MAVNLTAAVIAFIAALETVSGVPIAILERKDKTEEFWARSAAILCEKTKEPFCEEHMRFMTSNTEPMGQSQIIEYDFDGKGLKRVCAIIPPIPHIDPSSIAESYGNPHPGLEQSPASEHAAAWLMLYHASHCLDSELSDFEERRAAALATLGLSILGGDATFVPGINRSPARMLAVMTGMDAAYWAAGTGERILMDLWKEEAAYQLNRQFNCYAVVQPNSSIDIERIKRDRRGEDIRSCSVDEGGGGPGAARGSVSVTDANLWIWMFGARTSGQDGSYYFPGLGVPPLPYEPAKSFGSMEAAAEYVVRTSNELAR